MTVSVYIEFVVGQLDASNTSLAQISAESPNELVKVYRARSIAVKFSEESFGFVLLKMDTEIFESPHELVQVDLPVSIIIEDAEDTTNSANSHCSAAFQHVFDLLHDLICSQRRCDCDWLSLGSIRGEFNAPKVLLWNTLVYVLSDLNTLSFVGKDLCLGLCGGT